MHTILIKKNIQISENISIAYYDNELFGKEILFFVHGWGADKDNLRCIYNSFSEKYRVISIDLPGFGESTMLNGVPGTAEYSAVISEFLKKLDAGPVCFIGHSFGGKLGIYCSVYYKELISKMVLIDSSGLKSRRGLFWYARVYFYKFMKFFYLKILRAPEKLEKYRSKIGSDDYKESGSMRNVLVKVVNEDFRNILGRINCPVFIFWGAKDKDTPLWMGKFFHKHIADSGLYVVPGGGHFSFVDDSFRLISIIEHFIKE